MAKKFIPFYVLFLVLGLCSCKKFLDTKSDQKLSTPSTINDLQLMLDDPQLVTTLGMANTGTDEFYLLYTDWLPRVEDRKLSYVWDSQLDDLLDWTLPYQKIFVTNTVLFNLERINTDGVETKANNVKGSALFIRAHNFYQLAQYYAPQYNAASAANDLGIVLRLNADHSEASKRATVQETYSQIIKDLELAASLLPNTGLPKNRPSKASSYALLARVYLQIGDYAKSFEYADKSLQLYNTLLDYNSLVPFAATGYTFTFNNPEILYYSKSEASLNTEQAYAKVDTVLFASYSSSDLRKQAFYRKHATLNANVYRGNYSGEASVMFNGLATDEVYLIRAESNARNGNATAAIKDLETLMKKRIATASFTPYPAMTADQALTLILQERRKELVNRGTRWPDLRRLNKDPRFALTLKRNLNGQIYELPPNDLRYTLLIPREVYKFVNLPQNPR
jgi:starch-binding outer membrane protein, SusD/RagB family